MVLENAAIYGHPEERTEALVLVSQIRSAAELLSLAKEPESAGDVDRQVQDLDAMMGRLIRLMTWRATQAPGTIELVLRQDESSSGASRWWARFDGECPPFGPPAETGWSTAKDYGQGYAMALTVAIAAEKVLAKEPLEASSGG